jgi:rRNA-processing protein CGR1
MAGLNSTRLKKEGTRNPQRKTKEVSVKKASWDEKMKKRAQQKRVKDLQHALKEDVDREEQQARDARREARRIKEENERKNMVVQEIKNVKAIKKLSPKQRRKARIFMKNEL